MKEALAVVAHGFRSREMHAPVRPLSEQPSNCLQFEPMTTQELGELHRQWRAQGYLLLRNVIDKGRVAKLYKTSEAALEQWKSSTPEGEPGGYNYGPDAWVLLYLNHPKYLKNDRKGLVTLLNTVGDPLILAVLRELLAVEPIFGQVNYY